jgi:hypothetical protein
MRLLGRGGRKKSIFGSIAKSMGMTRPKRTTPQKAKLPKVITKAVNKQKLPNT